MDLDAHPLVSIITPTKNRADQLAELMGCLESQTYQRVEHVVIDGGSADGTLDLLKTRNSRMPLRWVSEPDDGVYAAVNKGLSLARGEVLAYLNTDDRYFPYTIEVAVKALVASPFVSFVYGDLIRMTGDDSRYSELYFYPPFRTGALRRARLLSQPTIFFRRKAASVAGTFDERLQLAADMDYWVRLAKIAPAQRINEVMAVESHHPGRLTAGQRAIDLAHEELELIRSKNNIESPVLQRWHSLADRLKAAVWDRLLRTRLLLRMSLNGRGHGWECFLAQRDFIVEPKKLLASLVPFRRSARACIRSDSDVWPQLRALTKTSSD